MRKLASLTIAGAMALAAAGLATSANAATFVGTDTVTAYPYGGPNSNNGLNILINNPTGLSFNLNSVGASTGYISLFTIYTDEQDNGLFEDTTNRPLTLAFNFSQPAPGSTGGFDGDTDAVWNFFGGTSNGRLVWDNTITTLNFASGYQLSVQLESPTETFNQGNGLNFTPGIAGGADVRANFTLTALPAAVPEPATWGMMIMGFGLAGATMRRRRTAAAAA